MTGEAAWRWGHGEWRLKWRRLAAMLELRSAMPPVPVAHGAGRELVVLGMIDWESRQQRPQMLASAMGARGWRVMYVDPTPYVLGPRGGALVGQGRGVMRARLQYRELRREDPHQMSMGQGRADAFSRCVHALVARAGMSRPVVMVQHPYWAPVIRGLARSSLVYDCMDLHQAFVDPHCSGFPRPERQLIADADLVTVTSAGLQRLAEGIRPCALVRNACDPGPFAATEAPPRAGRPIVMYIGAISWWFDAALVRAIAGSMPHVDIHLIGSPRGCDVSALASLPNVRLEGEVPHHALPGHLSRASVGIIPFTANQLTRMTDPVKAFEYLAAGRPVVSSIPFDSPGLPGVLVQTPRPTADAWADAITKVLDVARDPQSCAAAREFAAKNTWDHRAAELERAIVDATLTRT